MAIPPLRISRTKDSSEAPVIADAQRGFSEPLTATRELRVELLSEAAIAMDRWPVERAF